MTRGYSGGEDEEFDEYIRLTKRRQQADRLFLIVAGAVILFVIIMLIITHS